MNDSMTFSVLLLLFSVFISAVSQILLKKAAQKHYPNRLKEYLNPWVITAYSIFLLSTVLTMLALRTVPLSMQPILESTSYIYVSLMGYFLLKERFTRKKKKDKDTEENRNCRHSSGNLHIFSKILKKIHASAAVFHKKKLSGNLQFSMV